MKFLRNLGPGLLYAGAAIGVSHIVQSTKAGAQYGLILILGIVIAHLFKYPFFALGPRYAQRTGKDLIQGFALLDRKWVHLLLIMTVLTMFSIQAAVTMVTAGLLHKMTGLDLPIWALSSLLLVLCAAILLIGKFNLLEQLMKWVMLVLAVSTIAAMLLSFGIEREMMPGAEVRIFSIRNPMDLAFLIAFLGWMPAPLDIAIWHSIWSVNKKEEGGDGERDFKVGFYGTAFLAICFLILGANSLYGTGISLEVKASDFAGQLVDLYTHSLGDWSYPIILIAAFTTMFSTTLTCFDALPKVMGGIMRSYNNKTILGHRAVWMAILAVGSMSLLAFYVQNMGQMVTLATVVSFLVAPVLAWMSIRLVKRSTVELWNKNEIRLAWIGWLFLALFSLVYLSQL